MTNADSSPGAGHVHFGKIRIMPAVKMGRALGWATSSVCHNLLVSHRLELPVGLVTMIFSPKQLCKVMSAYGMC